MCMHENTSGFLATPVCRLYHRFAGHTFVPLCRAFVTISVSNTRGHFLRVAIH